MVCLLEGGDGEDIAAHKTTSVFINNIGQTVTKAELVEMASKLPGFQRLHLSSPNTSQAVGAQGSQQDRFARKCWISFMREAKIRELCFSLNSEKVGAGLGQQELKCLVNKDLSRRVRVVLDSPTNTARAREAALPLLGELIQFWDAKWGLHQPPPASQQGEGVDAAEVDPVSNPVLGTENLEHMVLYLRLVHSIDFYKGIEYPGEDEMPNRCGLLHVRPSSTDEVAEEEVEEYLDNFKAKLAKLMPVKTLLREEELARLGAKNEEQEIEKFIMGSMEELESDKWLCTLSQKKFKAPEFVRKHITNKFMHKIDEVKMETQFFNNYINDKERPEAVQAAPQGPARRPPVAAESMKRRAPADEDRMAVDEPPQKRSVKERLGNGGARITYNMQDPRSIIDYSDVDSFAFDFDY